MNETNNEEIEIDLSQLFRDLMSKWKIILACVLVCTIVSGLFTVFFIDKKYQSVSRIYLKPAVNEGIVDSTTITANNSMAKNYVKIMQGETILSTVADRVGSSLSEVKNAVTVAQESSDTQIIRISATTTNPELSKNIIDNTIDVFFSEMQPILQIDNMVILDEAKVNETAVSPNLKKNVLNGALLGLVGSCGVIVLMYALDSRLRTRAQAEQYLDVPVLGTVPYYKGQ